MNCSVYPALPLHETGHPAPAASRGQVVWFTGLSGAGKTTLARAVEVELRRAGRPAYVLDGDLLRTGLCADLGFSEEDRIENVRRVGELTRLFVDAGLVVLVAAISPLRRSRDWVRALHPSGDFIEVYCAATLETCERRDVIGLYRRARAGLIPEFTGVSSPYEAPLAAELALDTGQLALDACVREVLLALGS